MVKVAQEISGKVMKNTGSAAVLTNLGEYQDSKHLHFHVYSGQPLE
jgi:histidine triad (HIT) family protein